MSNIEDTAPNSTLLDEDRLAALTLGKTVAFLLYSLLVIVVVTGLLFLTPIADLSSGAADVVAWGLLLVAETGLLWMVVRGSLPGTSGARTEPFSERQVAIGCTILSAVIWLWPSTNDAKGLVQLAVNGALVLTVAVYFIVKSVLSRRLRLGVFAVLVLPTLQVIVTWQGRGA